MTTAENQIEARGLGILRGPAMAVAIACGAVVLGLIASSKPLLAAGAAAVGVLGLMVAATPNAATVVAIFLVFSNVAVVAHRYHGVPKVAAQGTLMLLLVPFVHQIVIRRQPIVMHPVIPLTALLLAVQLLGAAFSRDPAESWPGVMEYALEGLLILVLIINVVRTPRMLRYATWALVAGGLAMTIVPIYQQLTGSFDSTFGGFGQTTDIGFRTGEVTGHGEVRQVRLSGTIGEQNRFAQNLLMVLPLGLLLASLERSAWRKGVALAITAAVGLGCALAFSRGAAVAFVLTIGVMIAMRLITRRQVAMIALGTVVLLAVMPQYLARLVTIVNVAAVVGEDAATAQEADGAIRGRATEMIAAAQVYADHPIVGVGPGMFKYYSRQYGNQLGLRRLDTTREAHSLYLGMAAETGTLGLACFLGAVGVTMLGLLDVRKRWADERPELAAPAAAYFAALVAFLTAGIFLHMAYIRFFYLVLGLAAAAAVIGGGATRDRPLGGDLA